MHFEDNKEKIIIIDFGSQVTKLIARRVRDLGVFSEIITIKELYKIKDLSKIKYSVPEYIKSNLDISKYVLSIANAVKKDGGDGAIIIKLKDL